MSRKRKNLIILILLIIVFAFIIQKSLSKYVITLEQIHSQESTSFYFESDIADVDGKTYSIDDWDGQTLDIDFYVRNYIDSLQNADEDVTYTISVTTSDSDKVTATITDSSDDEVSSTDKLTMSSGSNVQDDYILNIVPVSIAEGDEVEINLSIKSTSPYEKELTSKITLTVKTTIDAYKASLANSSDETYVILSLQINEASDDISIKYDNTKLTLDMSTAIVNRSYSYTR